MPKRYEITVVIGQPFSDHAEDIKEAVCLEVYFFTPAAFTENRNFLVVRNVGTLYDESPEELANRLSTAIWEANGEFCPVEVKAAYVEDSPPHHHVFNREDYEVRLDPEETYGTVTDPLEERMFNSSCYASQGEGSFEADFMRGIHEEVGDRD